MGWLFTHSLICIILLQMSASGGTKGRVLASKRQHEKEKMILSLVEQLQIAARQPKKTRRERRGDKGLETGLWKESPPE